MAELYPTTKRDFMKAALAATSLLAAGASNRFLDLVAEYRRLEDEYNAAYSDNAIPAAEQEFTDKTTAVEYEMAETPITSQQAAREAVRLVNRRLNGCEATYIDRAILRNVQLFMEG